MNSTTQNYDPLGDALFAMGADAELYRGGDDHFTPSELRSEVGRYVEEAVALVPAELRGPLAALLAWPDAARVVSTLREVSDVFDPALVLGPAAVAERLRDLCDALAELRRLAKVARSVRRDDDDALDAARREVEDLVTLVINSGDWVSGDDVGWIGAALRDGEVDLSDRPAAGAVAWALRGASDVVDPLPLLARAARGIA